MRVAVLGGGVVGVACAYWLCEDGHEVTLIERAPELAGGTSYGNAGFLSPGDSYAWASPSSLAMFLKSLIRRDLGIKVRPRLDPALWSWTWKFLFECTDERARINTLRKLRLTLYSRLCQEAIVRKTGVQYDASKNGIVYFYRSQAGLDAGVRHMRLLADHGLAIEVLDRDGLVGKEPALAGARDKLAGGVFSPMDQTGDSRKFTQNLARWCVEHRGLKLLQSTRIEGLDAQGRRIARVMTDTGPVEADAFVLAAGVESPVLARPLGIDLPIYPVKGYSMTVPIRDGDVAPRMGGVDEDKLVAFSRLGDRLRVAATAEFAGLDRSHKPSDFAAMRSVIKELLPKGGDYARAEYWAGLRPMTPSSVPVLGRARYDNLYLDVGHGHVGWTMAAGSGKFVADLISGRQPEIDAEGLVYEG